MALDDDIRDLSRNIVFRDLDTEALRLIAFAAETRQYGQGDVLFRQGDPSDGGYVLREGSVLLEGGSESLIVLAPAVLGESALMTGTVRGATAIVREPTRAMMIPRGLFLRALSEYPDGAVRLRRNLAHRLRVFSGAIAAAGAELAGDDE